MERVMIDFRENFTPSQEQLISFGYFEVKPETADLTVRDVLPLLFGFQPLTH